MSPRPQKKVPREEKVQREFSDKSRADQAHLSPECPGPGFTRDPCIPRTRIFRVRTRCDRVSMYLSRGPLFSRSHGPRDVQKCPPHAQASTSSHPSSNPCKPRQSDPIPHGHTYIHPNTPSCTRKAEGRARGATAVPSWRPTDTLQKDKRDQTREN